MAQKGKTRVLDLSDFKEADFKEPDLKDSDFGRSDLGETGEPTPGPAPSETETSAEKVDSGASTQPDPEPGYLGVVSHAIDAKTAELYGLDRGAGVVLSRIRESSPAARAGLEPFQVITHIEGQALRSHRDLERVVRSQVPGQEIELELRGGDRRRIVLGSRADLPESSPLRQAIVVNWSLERISAHVRERWKEGYGLSSIAGRDGAWTAVLTSPRVDRLQGFVASDSLSDAWRKIEGWDQAGWSIQELEYDGRSWALVFEKSHRQPAQRVVRLANRNELEKSIREKQIQGFAVSSLAYGSGRWVAVFTKNERAASQKIVSVSSTQALTDAIQEQRSENLVIVSAARHGGEWLAALSEAPRFEQRWMRRKDETVLGAMQSGWAEGYAATVHCSGPKTWFLTLLRRR